MTGPAPREGKVRDGRRLLALPGIAAVVGALITAGRLPSCSD